MTSQELSSVEAGEPLGTFRYKAGAAVVESVLNEGVVPKGSHLSGPDTETFVATDDFDRPLAAVALEDIHGGEAKLGVRSLEPGMESQTSFMRAVIQQAMHESGVHVATLEPELADDVPVEQFGFNDQEEHYTFVAT